jgi:hypothetical protein
MTEAEWLACTDPMPMLEFLQGKASERKFLLLSVACCRRIVNSFTNERSKKAFVDFEQFADRDTDKTSIQEALIAATARAIFPSRLARATREAASRLWQTAGAAGRAVKVHEGEQKWSVEMQAQASLIRDLFGPVPFRPTRFDPCWLAWHDGLLVSMARQMYDSRDFTDMLILADALEEAGCSDQDILGHCRSGGEHVRGCWVIDLLLGKE